MTKLSRMPIDKRRIEYFINNFWSAVTLLEDKEEVKNFFKDLLSYTEARMLAKRLQIAKMLVEGYDYQTIKRYTKVTDQTISKLNNLLRSNGRGLEKAVNHLKKVESQREKELEAQNPLSFANYRKRYKGYYWPEEALSLLGQKLKSRAKKKSVS